MSFELDKTRPLQANEARDVSGTSIAKLLKRLHRSIHPHDIHVILLGAGGR